jgi:hypothetical protein
MTQVYETRSTPPNRAQVFVLEMNANYTLSMTQITAR